MSVHESVALRRRLRVELRRARLGAGLTQKDVAERLEWSPSKIIRIESGTVAITVTDLRALAAELGITDPKAVGELEDMARGSKKQPWGEYRGVLTPATIQLYSLEAVASLVRHFELILVPGLLQTEEYARAMLPKIGISPERADRIVDARLERQELLDQPHAPRMVFLIDEAAIRRVVGGPKTMEAQLRRISELARHPKITVRIIPFPAGAHEGMDGPLTYLEFPDADDDPVVYIEGRHGTDAVFKDDPDATAEYLRVFLDLERIACPADEVDEYLGRAIERLPEHEAGPAQPPS